MKTRLAAAGAALVLAVMAQPAGAQDATDPAATGPAPVVAAEDDGFDMGWLGLLGLAGLLGLRRKPDATVRTTGTRPV